MFKRLAGYSETVGRRLVRLAALLTFLNGALSLLTVLRHGRPPLDSDLLPFGLAATPRILAGLAVGLGLMYFSVQLLRRKRTAWLVAVGGMAFLSVLHLFFNRDLAAAAINLLSALLLALSVEQFKVKSDTGSMRQSALAFLAVSAVVVLYGALGFLSLGKTGFDRPVGAAEAVRAAAAEYINAGSGLRPNGRLGGALIDSLNLMGVISAGLAFYSLFKPLRFKLVDSPADRGWAERILKHSSDWADDYFCLWPKDKRYFFNPDRTAFVAYRVVDSVALALHRPYGPPRAAEELFGRFTKSCRQNGWEPAFVYCDARLERAAQKYGLKLQKIGQAALVDIEEFCARTAGNKHFRHVSNRFKRLGYRFEIIEPAALHNHLLRQLKTVSDAWLGQGKTEKGFATGYFDKTYLRRCRVAVARAPDGRIEAFANLVPLFQTREASVDLIRYLPGAPGNTVDFLLLKLIARLNLEGYDSFDLGLAPLSGLEAAEGGRPSVETRALKILRLRGGFLYGFEGVERFKTKFDPLWQDRFVAYGANPYTAARVALALNKAMSVKAES